MQPGKQSTLKGSDSAPLPLAQSAVPWWAPSSNAKAEQAAIVKLEELFKEMPVERDPTGRYLRVRIDCDPPSLLMTRCSLYSSVCEAKRGQGWPGC